ncbi:MAG TPA: amidase family protein [Verrucomicrobiae bacterium]|jgi:aspartyl-tRNA(Asn)/glutamyl-tRNA(Gln) amidotransferase subunit A|nr:amidase family protein [Verrucomicrobiae bacterium]
MIEADALTLARQIRTKAVSPVAVVDAVLRRIEALQPTVNAFITVTADEARDAAHRAEAAVTAGAALGPLHGVPFSVKDLLFTKGARVTMGSLIFADQVAPEDAVPVRRLREAGAILIGKTTTPEFGHKPLTDSPLFGATRNPWDRFRTAGGSSGGAAAAVATGQGPLALGTDGGGSIRIPAACCGIVGLKPTLGRVPHIQQADLFSSTSYIGPMARTVAEVAACFDVIVGFDAADPYSRPEPPDDPRRVEVRGLRIGWLPRVGNRLVDSEVLAACEAVVRHLESQGARVDTVDEDFAAQEDAFLVVLQGGLAARVGPHMAKFGDKVAPSLRQTVESGARWSAADWARAAGQRTAIYRRINMLFENSDLLVSPTISRPALALDHDAFQPITIGGETAGSIRGAWYPYLWPFNLSGHPAISLPCGWSSDGLPIGLQIVGPWYADRRVLALAEHLERERPCARSMPL